MVSGLFSAKTMAHFSAAAAAASRVHAVADGTANPELNTSTMPVIARRA